MIQRYGGPEITVGCGIDSERVATVILYVQVVAARALIDYSHQITVEEAAAGTSEF